MVIAAAFILPGILAGGTKVFAALQPGSAEDPLITRSYLEERLNNLNLSAGGGSVSGSLSEEMLQFIIEEVLKGVGNQTVATTPEAPATIEGFDRGSLTQFTPVNVLNNQRLIGAEGTEIIMRGGSGSVFSQSVDGLVNMTTGEELVHSNNVSLNNLLIVPRADGRGVTVTSGDAWFIVRGLFRIEG